MNEKPRIVVLDGRGSMDQGVDPSALYEVGDIEYYDLTPVHDKEEIIRRIGDARYVLLNKTPIDEEVLDRCPDLEYIGVLATGYNVVDTASARSRGVTVTNIPSYGTMGVAQFTIGLLLEILNRMGHHDRLVREGRWTKAACYSFWEGTLHEAAGMTMGIVGFGRIGQATGRIAKALGMEVLAVDSHPTEEGRALARYVELPELLAASDVVSLHCPLFPETEKLINSDTIAMMKDGAILLNASRGQLVDPMALTEALNSGKLAAAGLDVCDMEPMPDDHPYLSAKNCILTPHIAWAAVESRQRLANTAIDNLKQYLAGNTVNAVN